MSSAGATLHRKLWWGGAEPPGATWLSRTGLSGSKCETLEQSLKQIYISENILTKHQTLLGVAKEVVLQTNHT